MTKLSGDNGNFVYNEAFENEIDNLVSNTSEKPLTLKKKNLQREHHYKSCAKILRDTTMIGRTTFSSPTQRAQTIHY